MMRGMKTHRFVGVSGGWSPTIVLLAFAGVVFFFFFGDALMSYGTPIYLQSRLHNELLMGAVMGFSSLVGIGLDMWLGEQARGKNYRFFLWWAFIFAFLFPLSFLLFPEHVVAFLFAMAVWGIYYEFIQFSQFHFVHTFMDPKRHSFAWGWLSLFQVASYTLAPLLAAGWLDIQIKMPFAWASIFFSASLLAFGVFVAVFDAKHGGSHMGIKPKNIWEEFDVWKILFTKLKWLWFFTFVLVFVDAAFWSVGTLLSESLRAKSIFGAGLLVAHMLPQIFMGGLSAKLARFGKKRVAFGAGVLSGILLLGMGWMTNVGMILILVFASSAFAGIAMPQMMATFEDYMARLGGFGNDLVGLERSAVSMAYFLGPLVSGAMAVLVGNQWTLALAGGLLTIAAGAAFVGTPRKVRMPQGELVRYRDNQIAE